MKELRCPICKHTLTAIWEDDEWQEKGYGKALYRCLSGPPKPEFEVHILSTWTKGVNTNP